MAKRTSRLVAHYRGRLWVTILLLPFAPICFLLALATPTLDQPLLAMILMGGPMLFAAYLTAAYAWGEAIANVEIREDGFWLHLPQYRGYLPWWPAQRLAATWPEVKSIRRTTVRGAMTVIPFRYTAYRISTSRGEAVLIDPAPDTAFGPAKGICQNIPAAWVAKYVCDYAGLKMEDGGTVYGGGLLRNLLFGGP